MTIHHRVVTRSRPSLSCLPCKRRKVKCEKQHPTCGNCMRMQKVCCYEPFQASRIAVETSLDKKRKLMTTSAAERVAPSPIERRQSEQILSCSGSQENVESLQWSQLQMAQPPCPPDLPQTNIQTQIKPYFEQDPSHVRYSNPIDPPVAASIEYNATEGPACEESRSISSPDTFQPIELGGTSICNNTQHSGTSIAAPYLTHKPQETWFKGSTTPWPIPSTPKHDMKAPTFAFEAPSPLLGVGTLRPDRSKNISFCSSMYHS